MKKLLFALLVNIFIISSAFAGGIVMQPFTITGSVVVGDLTANTITISDGTAVNPSIRFVSDPDTGIYKFFDDTVGFSGGGLFAAGFNSFAFTINPTASLQWFGTNPAVGQESDILKMRSIFVPDAVQQLRIYYDGPDDTNYARFSIVPVQGEAISLASEAGGTESKLPIKISTTLTTPGGTLNDGDSWFECSGTTPSRVCSVKIRDGGATISIDSPAF